MRIASVALLRPLDRRPAVVVLAGDDARSLDHRVPRLRLLLDEYGEEGEWRVFYGQLSAYAFEEARRAYLHGLFLSTVLIAQVYVEHTIASLLVMANRDADANLSFAKTLVIARDDDWISPKEYELWDRLRRKRNPYTHHRPIDHRESLVRRAMDAGQPPDEILMRDATEAIVAVLRLARRRPFAA